MVIAIIAILAGMLLPALSAARRAARKTVVMSNLRQMVHGFTMYAGDFDGLLPYRSAILWEPQMYASNGTTWMSPVSLGPLYAADKYGFGEATAHPITGSPPWTRGSCFPLLTTSPAAAGYCASPWALYFGFTVDPLTQSWAGSAVKGSPLRLAKGKGEQLMVQEFIRDDGGTNGMLYAEPAPKSAHKIYTQGFGHADKMFVGSDLDGVGLKQIDGVHAGFFGGNAKWFGVDELNRKPYQNGNYLVGVGDF